MSRIKVITTGQTGPSRSATATTFTPTGTIAATDVQAAIAEVSGDVTAHLNDTDDAHDASAVSVLDTGGYYTGTNVETVLAELPSRFLPWQPNTAYTAGTFVSNAGTLYTVNSNFTTGGSFSTSGLTAFTGSGSGAASRVTFSNANYTIVATDSVFVAQTGTMAAARTVTLPAASTFTAGAFITVIDESGTVTPTLKISVARAGSDTINGAATSAVISSSYGQLTLISDGSSKWTTPTAVSSFTGTGSESVRIGELSIASAAGAHAVGYGAQATAGSANAFGYDARAGAQYNTAVGSGSRAISGTACTSVGFSATSVGNFATAYGYGANASVIEALAIGGSSAAAGSGSIAIGTNASVVSGQTDGIAIGRGAAITAGSGENIAIGGYANAGEWRATAIGFRARATAISATAIGRKAYASATHSVAIGRGAWINAANAVAIGWSGGDAATDVFFESGHTHKYVDEDSTTITRNPSLTPIVIHGFDAYDATGSPTNNVAGGPLVLAAGRGTGTAIGGAVKLQVAPAGGASNNTKNTLVTVVEAGCSTTAPTLGFFAATPVVKPTGVAVTAGGIHAALVSLGLIAA